MSWKRLEDIFARRLQDVLKTFLQDFLITFWRRLEDILPRRLEGVLKMSWGRFQNVLKTSWKCLENIFPRRLEDVLKTYDQDEYIGLDQDIFWRHMTKANIFVLIKTSWRRLLKPNTKDVLKDVFWSRRRKTSSRHLQTSSSRQMFAGWKQNWKISNTALILLLWLNVVILSKNGDFLLKNADKSRGSRY